MNNPVSEKFDAILRYLEKDYFLNEPWTNDEWYNQTGEFYNLHKKEFNECLFKALQSSTEEFNPTRVIAVLILIRGFYYLDKEEEDKIAILFYQLLEKLHLDLDLPYAEEKAWVLYHIYDIIWHNSALYELDPDRMVNIINKTRFVQCQDINNPSDCSMAVWKAVDLLSLIDTSKATFVLKLFLTHKVELTRNQAKETLKGIEERKTRHNIG